MLRVIKQVGNYKLGITKLDNERIVICIQNGIQFSPVEIIPNGEDYTIKIGVIHSIPRELITYINDNAMLVYLIREEELYTALIRLYKEKKCRDLGLYRYEKKLLVIRKKIKELLDKQK